MKQYAKTLLAAATAAALLSLVGQAQANVIAHANNSLTIWTNNAYSGGLGYVDSFARLGTTSDSQSDPSGGTAPAPLTSAAGVSQNGDTSGAGSGVVAHPSGAVPPPPSPPAPTFPDVTTLTANTSADVNLDLSASENGQANSSVSWDVVFELSDSTIPDFFYTVDFGLSTDQTVGYGDTSSASSSGYYQLTVKDISTNAILWDSMLIALTGSGQASGLIPVFDKSGGLPFILGVSLYSQAIASYDKCNPQTDPNACIDPGPGPGPGPGPNPAPEPATLALLGLGLAGLGLMRRRVR